MPLQTGRGKGGGARARPPDLRLLRGFIVGIHGFGAGVMSKDLEALTPQAATIEKAKMPQYQPYHPRREPLMFMMRTGVPDWGR